MGNKKFTYNEYEAEERDSLMKLYCEKLEEVESIGFTGKDLGNNSSVCIKINRISPNGDMAYGETPFGQTVTIDVNREEKILDKLGYPAINIFPGQLIDVVVYKDYSGGFTGSVAAGYEKLLKKELNDAIKNENCAYKVKVTSVCNGGFMVDLSGIQCFLPGSLAAANRIMDFSQYVGKEITVMAETYDQKRDIFVVSFKKYLKKIIDGEVQNLSFCERYDGVVTGASNSGIFVEWNEIFTGIIPFENETKEKLSELKAGDNISFYIIDIKNPHRIILSLTEPSDKLKNVQELKDSSFEVLGEDIELKIYKGEITKIKAFGTFVKLENGLIGLIEKENLVNPIKDYEVGQLVNCTISSVDLSTLKIQLMEEE